MISKDLLVLLTTWEKGVLVLTLQMRELRLREGGGDLPYVDLFEVTLPTVTPPSLVKSGPLSTEV